METPSLGEIDRDMGYKSIDSDKIRDWSMKYDPDEGGKDKKRDMNRMEASSAGGSERDWCK